jgi:hypothetical protein
MLAKAGRNPNLQKFRDLSAVLVGLNHKMTISH